MTLREMLVAALSQNADFDANIVFMSKSVDGDDDLETTTALDDDGSTVEKGVILPNSPVAVQSLNISDEGEITLSN